MSFACMHDFDYDSDESEQPHGTPSPYPRSTKKNEKMEDTESISTKATEYIHSEDIHNPLQGIDMVDKELCNDCRIERLEDVLDCICDNLEQQDIKMQEFHEEIMARFQTITEKQQTLADELSTARHQERLLLQEIKTNNISSTITFTDIFKRLEEIESRLFQNKGMYKHLRKLKDEESNPYGVQYRYNHCQDIMNLRFSPAWLREYTYFDTNIVSRTQ